jgi:hypothetical protein
MKCREVITPLGEMLGLDIPPTLLALADEVARVHHAAQRR